MSKQEADVASGILEALNKMEDKPKFIYTDDEGSFSSVAVKDILKKRNITHIISRNHAPVAERAIRTFKDMLYKRIDNDINNGKNNIQWHTYIYIYPILLTQNNKNEHRSTGMTPAEATKSENETSVRIALETNAKRNRKYPTLEVGDKVKIFTKRKVGEKERVPIFPTNKYEVESIDKKHGLNFFTVNNRQYMRNELLK